MNYYTLGRSGLRVSRLALGTMTFGTENGWGCDRGTSRALFDRYLDAGGNFIDTADIYSHGTSESWLGEFIEERGAWTSSRRDMATRCISGAEIGVDPKHYPDHLVHTIGKSVSHL